MNIVQFNFIMLISMRIQLALFEVGQSRYVAAREQGNKTIFMSSNLCNMKSLTDSCPRSNRSCVI